MEENTTIYVVIEHYDGFHSHGAFLNRDDAEGKLEDLVAEDDDFDGAVVETVLIDNRTFDGFQYDVFENMDDGPVETYDSIDDADKRAREIQGFVVRLDEEGEIVADYREGDED